MQTKVYRLIREKHNNMKAIILPDYNANIVRAMKSLEVSNIAIPKPGDHEVLIKVDASPCNPSDIAFMRGGYNVRKPVPAVMGFECSGTIIETGPSPEAREFLGKRVSCFGRETDSGTWAEYFLTRYDHCLDLRDDLSIEQSATLCINPFTAYALLQLALDSHARAIIQNGASGQIGIFIRAMARHHGIKVINLVRKEEHIKQLNLSGEQYVINLTDEHFSRKLEEMAKGLQATLALDAVGGEISGAILNAMPSGSQLVIYGGLSGKFVGQVNALDIIFKRKTIRGFNLNDWKAEIGEKRFQDISQQIQKMIVDGQISTRIQGTFALGSVQQAMEQYIRNMSAGKILFTP